MIGVIGLVLSVCGVGLAWAVASPLGASPDDDYHLGSIWCPPPLADSGCTTGYTERGTFGPVVPESIAATRVACYAFHGNESAVCALNNSDERTMVTDRWDDGNYPWGYYQFHHHFIAHDAGRAGVTMRLINVGIAIVLIGAIGALMPSAMRRGYVLAILAAWTPMGIYFIASTNPSSWAFTGVFAFAAGLWSATQSYGWRRWSLLGAAALGAVLSCTSRGDSAFFLFVITVALAFAVRWRREHWPEATLAIVASIIGIIVMRSTNVASTHLTTAQGEHRSLIDLLGDNMSFLPQYLAGFYGYRWGPGWLDVNYDGSISTVGLLIAGAVFIAGARTWSWRKLMTLLTLVGRDGWRPDPHRYSPRVQQRGHLPGALHDASVDRVPVLLADDGSARAHGLASAGCRARRAGGRDPVLGVVPPAAALHPWFLGHPVQSESDGRVVVAGCPHRPEHGLGDRHGFFRCGHCFRVPLNA